MATNHGEDKRGPEASEWQQGEEAEWKDDSRVPWRSRIVAQKKRLGVTNTRERKV